MIRISRRRLLAGGGRSIAALAAAGLACDSARPKEGFLGLRSTARRFGSMKLGYKMVKYVSELSFLPMRTGGYWENRGYEWWAGV